MNTVAAEARCRDLLRFLLSEFKVSYRSVAKQAEVASGRIVAQDVLVRQQKIQKMRSLESRLLPLYIQEWNINLQEIRRFQQERQSDIRFEDILQEASLIDQLPSSDWLWLQAKVNQQIIERRFLLAIASWEKRDMDYRKAHYDFIRTQNNFADLDNALLPDHAKDDQSDYLKAYLEFSNRREKWKKAKQDIKDLNASLNALRERKPMLFFKEAIIPHDGLYPETEEAFVQERRAFLDDCRRLGISF